MPIEDDVNALQSSDATQNGRLDQLDADAVATENRLSVLETFKNDVAARLLTLEEDRRALKKDYPYKALHIPFYTAEDEVALADAANVSIPTDYGNLYLKADADYEFDGYTLTLELGAAVNLTVRDSTGAAVVNPSAFSSTGVYLLKRISGQWKVTRVGGVFVQA